MKRYLLAVCVAAGGLFVPGCGDATGPNVALLSDLSLLPYAEDPLVSGRIALRVAYVGKWDDSAAVAVMGRAKAGQAVQVSVTSIGGGCVAEDSTVVRVNGLEALVVPYQRVRAGGVCTANLLVNRRVVPVTFEAAGLAVVRVVGRSGPNSQLTQFVQPVTVRP